MPMILPVKSVKRTQFVTAIVSAAEQRRAETSRRGHWKIIKRKKEFEKPKRERGRERKRMGGGLRALVSPASCNRDRFPSGSRLLARQFSLARFSLPRNRRETNDPIKWPARLSPSLSLFSRPLARRARDCRLDVRASL